MIEYQDDEFPFTEEYIIRFKFKLYRTRYTEVFVRSLAHAQEIYWSIDDAFSESKKAGVNQKLIVEGNLYTRKRGGVKVTKWVHEDGNDFFTTPILDWERK